MCADAASGSKLTSAHRSLIRLLAKAAVEEYLAEERETVQPTDMPKAATAESARRVIGAHHAR